MHSRPHWSPDYRASVWTAWFQIGQKWEFSTILGENIGHFCIIRPQKWTWKIPLPPSTSSLVIQRTNFRALKYSNIGVLFSRSASNIHTLTLARVTAVYRCFSSEFRTLCWLGSKVRALGRPVCCRTSGRKYIIQVKSGFYFLYFWTKLT